MLTRELTINNKSGLHARPATLWVQTASRFRSKIKIKRGGSVVEGKSILGILSLGLSAGSVFELLVEGEDETEAVATLEQLMIDLENQDR
ncbi:HPr family phosphocarrier protein [Desulfosporosinus sp. BICA1-9]|uniref:HPr family phosphocarrier protein n=1 Tax=Desulfosporosinus sp. BICA1-9 TaxID=1531958 RepID=UPI00054C0BC8|nr:HPr family phosphocarrier protein [Desulfosporosinus sp. BICA1-9]KJS50619.1 MAG: phosphocarrier protein HPr [Peptococcaceae bacterium BRH_c23]KJS82324.1 MAG: phosphocarrier protein HPr [Desulfosporosinus sp. BICA1-9]HBW37399.1 HPr family phosphocarrier protein [Desulfosporosinus sp.]